MVKYFALAVVSSVVRTYLSSLQEKVKEMCSFTPIGICSFLSLIQAIANFFERMWCGMCVWENCRRRREDL